MIVFARRNNTLTNESLESAINHAKHNFKAKHGKDNNKEIRISIGDPDNHAGLQIVDYCLWALNRFLTTKECGYLECIKDKIKLIVDMDDKRKNGYGEYYSDVSYLIKEVS
jgi:hypothetical protein